MKTAMNARLGLTRPLGFASLLLVLCAALFAACGTDDVGARANTPCALDDDCPVGTVCGYEKFCVAVSCTLCEPGQVCFVTPENPAGSCSRPECLDSSDCTDGKSCQSGLCKSAAASCTSDATCPEGEVCSLAGQCVASATGCQDSTNCPQGQICNDSNQCVPDASNLCASVTCPEGQTCDAASGQCTGGSTGGNCPGANPAACSGATPHFNTQFCACVACLDNSHCSGGRTCGVNGQCTGGNAGGACQTACNPNTPGICGGSTPYCINNCCAQCVGAADCPSGQVCVDGTCGQAPSCAADPTVCPAGFVCQDGTCTAPQAGGGGAGGGQSCDPQDPMSCGGLAFCDPSTSTCQSPGGDLGCGLCNPDCTCGGTATCNGFLCEGCSFLDPSSCPAGQICLPGLDICFPLGG